jgi:hypothetical protein
MRYVEESEQKFLFQENMLIPKRREYTNELQNEFKYLIADVPFVLGICC